VASATINRAPNSNVTCCSPASINPRKCMIKEKEATILN
jgi:hypothetical protein